MRCAIYCRLSKEDEEKTAESESIQNQKALLLQFALAQGWEVYQIYCDEDYSGADRQRPAFRALLLAAEAGCFEIVLCKTQSRFTRDMELVEKYIHYYFPLWGIRFVTAVDHVDTASKGNKKARQINGLVNEWYLEDLSENIRAVLDYKRQTGQYIGSFALYGYQKDSKDRHHLAVDEEAAAVVRQIFSRYLAGDGLQKIAGQLNREQIPNPSFYKHQKGWHTGRQNNSGLWSGSTVKRILQNEMYAGTLVQGRQKKLSYKSKQVAQVPPSQWLVTPQCHEPIIDPQTFWQVQKLLQLATKAQKTGERHWLCGKVFCQGCGSAMCQNSKQYQGRQTQYLSCKQYRSRQNGPKCSNHNIRLDYLADLIEERMNWYLHNWFDAEAILQTLVQTIRTAQGNQRQQLQKQLERQQNILAKQSTALKLLYLDRAAGLLTEPQFATLAAEIIQEQKNAEQRAAELKAQLKSMHETNSSNMFCIHWVYQQLSCNANKRELAALLIDRVEIGEKPAKGGEQEIKVYWLF